MRTRLAQLIRTEVLAAVVPLFKDLKSEFTSELESGLASVRSELGSEIASVRSELGSEIASVKSELGSEIASVKSELGSEIASVRSELGSEIASVKSELGTVKSDITGLKQELRSGLQYIHADIIDLTAKVDTALDMSLRVVAHDQIATDHDARLTKVETDVKVIKLVLSKPK
jgi:gas vesicle protein